MLLEYPADFHIHTCLSPCASDEMTPINILNMAKVMGTKILGICDHNSAGNINAMLNMAQDYDILVIPGIEVQSVEEVHLLCLFENIDQVLELQEYVYGALPSIKNNPQYFGHQWLVDERGNILGEEDRMLVTSISLTVDEVAAKVHELQGIIIPAHVDRKHFSIIGQLGFIPDNLSIDAIEFSRAISPEDFKSNFKHLLNYPLITSSDAHSLQEMVYQKTCFLLKELSFKEILMALRGLEGRKVLIRD